MPNCPECNFEMEILLRNGREYFDCPDCGYAYLVNPEEYEEEE